MVQVNIEKTNRGSKTGFTLQQYIDGNYGGCSRQFDTYQEAKRALNTPEYAWLLVKE